MWSPGVTKPPCCIRMPPAHGGAMLGVGVEAEVINHSSADHLVTSVGGLKPKPHTSVHKLPNGCVDFVLSVLEVYGLAVNTTSTPF